jgi:hypothetical protein
LQNLIAENVRLHREITHAAQSWEMFFTTLVTTLHIVTIEYFRLYIEYLRYSFDFKMAEGSDIHKYSICNLQFSIPARPGWGIICF